MKVIAFCNEHCILPEMCIIVICCQYLSNEIDLGKSWACKHWKFQNNYFVIIFAFLLHFFCIWVCHFGFVLSCVCHFVCHFFVISLSFFVICLSFYCHFIVILGSGKWRKNNVKK